MSSKLTTIEDPMTRITEKSSDSDPTEGRSLFDNVKDIIDFVKNTTDGPLIDPPDLKSSDWTDWLVFFWRNLFPFIIWILAMVWVCYLCFYNSRVFGLIFSRIVNRFIKNGYFRVGSISLATISGKIMFRDFVYVNEDYSLRIQDGWLVFRWWLPYMPRDVKTEDFSNSEVRLLVLLNGFELHVYNRTKRYKELEKLFGLNSRLNGDDDCDSDEEVGSHSLIDSINETTSEGNGSQWRDLIPVTKFEITSGRFVFGNHLIPSTLSIVIEESYFVYTTRPAVSPHDLFTHLMKCKAENVKVILAPSPKFLGISDEPPRYMGEGFVVFQSNNIDVYYYQDEPGLASDRPEKLELANGDIIEKFTSPVWGLVIKCGKGTDFSYGPWADRQRELLYNFFYPSDYKPMEINKRPKSGERRVFEAFDIRLSTLSDATIDVLFSKNKETSALHVNAGPGSYLEITIPWVNSETGYVSHINGQIMHLDATTSLQFRPLAVSETLEFDVKIAYPRVWNEHQLWTCSLTGCKATVNLIYAHKLFFQALIEDWAGKARPDILKFVPYTCKISVVLKEFELLTLANEYNWIDCSTALNGENSELAICGEIFDMTFDLPFVEFLPPFIDIKIWIQGESLETAFYLPESNTHRDIIEALHTYARITSRDGNTISKSKLFTNDRKWRNVVTRDNNWYECWTAPIVALSIAYKYWPIPPKTYFPKESEITTPELEEILLSPMRPNRSPKRLCSAPDDFDPLSLEPDVIAVELEIGPSVIGLFGSLFRMLWNIKDNYLGESQEFSDSSCNSFSFFDKFSEINQKNINNNNNSDHMEMEFKPFDARIYRPFEVTVSVTLHDIQAHLMKCCNDDDPPCPSVYTERLCFELHKTYSETQLQLLIAPLVLISTDIQSRVDSNSHLKNGFLTLSSLQFRGHAMFSGVDRPLESETLEYSWLVDVQLGDIAGRLTLPQVQHIITPLETFLLQVMQTDCSLQPPFPYQKCLHDLIQSVCPQSTVTKLCPYPEDLKYRMVRLSIDAIDVYLVESNVAISVQLIPIKFSMCNIHSCHTSIGITVLINKLLVRQFVRTNSPSHTLSNSTKSRLLLSREVSQWLEVSSLSMGPVFVDSASLLSSVDNYTQSQHTFLKTHDKKTKRLWFLWSDDTNVLPPNLMGKCGCVGGSAFFGNNRDGLNFFSVSDQSKQYSNTNEDISRFYSEFSRNKDLAFGESLLHRGEYVLGLRVDTDTDCDEELLDLVPFFEEQFSPSVSESMSDSKTELKSRFKYGFMSRQLTTPAPNNSLTVSAPHMPKDLSPIHPRSPTKSASFRIPSQSQRNQTFDSSDESFRRNRSLSDSGGAVDDALKKSSLILDIIKSRQNSESINSEKKVDFEPNSPKYDSEVFRTKSLESASSASERYFSAEDVSNSAKSSSISSDTPSLHPVVVSSDSYHSAELPNPSSDSTTQYYSCLTSESVTLTRDETKRKSCGDTHSLHSSNSFISALSSHEDLALVDLRNQMEKPIPESPLLMSSYTSHLSQYVCYNWDIPPPVPHFTPSHISSKDWFMKKSQWRPKFRVNSHGFSCLRITRKEESSEQNTSSLGDNYNNDFIPGSVFFEMDKNLGQKSGSEEPNNENKGNKSKKIEDIISKNVELKSEKMTILIKFNNEIDIKLSPLSLEGLKTFIDSVTPTLASLHSVSVLNHLNLNCLNEVEANNKLKKEKMLYLGQLNAKAWQTLIRRQNSNQNNRRIVDNKDTSLVANQLEEQKNFKLLSFVYINKININLIQASIVEELISFAALDNIKDLTCVSVMSVSINDISFFSSHHIQQRRTLHTFMDQSSVSTLSYTEKALMSRFFGKKPKKELSEIESLTIETVDTSLEETIASSSISAIHIQLSRLKNSSSILKDAILTVIPCRHSKVGFRIVRSQSSGASDSDHSSRQSRLSRKPLQRQDCVPDSENDCENIYLKVQNSSAPTDEEHLLGFIMFECGIEEINIKGVKIKKNEENFVELKPKINESIEMNADFVKDIKSTQESSHSSSCVGEVSTVWFNFAAPPKTPNTRKIDFTRLDWHLLSSAAPSISAWISVADRLILSAKCLSKLREQRVNSVIVCLMTSGLEVKGVHIPPQSKHLSRLFTPLAKSLQDDPSCQLVSALRRYYNSMDSSEEFESNFKPETLPCLSDLQRGIVALCRQWKNALYMPLFIQQNLRLRKGDKHPLRVLLEERSKQISVETDSGDEDNEDNDETTQLLNVESTGMSVGPKHFDKILVENIETNVKNKSSSIVQSNSQPNDDSNVGSGQPKRKQSVIQTYFPRSTRASITIPPLITAPFETIGTGVNKAYEYLFSPNSQNSGTRLVKREESQMSLKSTQSSSDPNVLGVDQLIGGETRVDGSHDNYGEENLYWWMARQQDYMKNVTNLTNSLRKPSAPLLEQDSKLNTLNSGVSLDNDVSNNIHSQNITAPDVSFLPTVAQMSDVRDIFHPFISSLSISLSEENSNSCLEFGQFGTKLSICGRIKLFKIDIIESENRNSPNRSRSPSRMLSPNRIPVVNFEPNSSPFKVRLKADNSLDSSAFVCEGLGVEFDLRKVKEYEKSEVKQQKDSKVCPIVIVGPDGMSQTTTLLNFSVDINCIDQRVNLPLLRLLHQFTAMYENVKETRLEMRSNRVHSFRDSLRLEKCKTNTSETDTTSRTPSSSSFKNEPLVEQLSKSKEEVAIVMPEDCDSDSDVTLVEDPVQLREPLVQPKCWKTMYYLLDLYQTKPETKTVIERVSSLIQSGAPVVPETKIQIDEADYKGSGRYEPLKDVSFDIEESSSQSAAAQPKANTINAIPVHRKSNTNIVSSDQLKNFTNALIQREWTPIVVFGVCKIRRVGLLAMLSGLKLEGELSSFHVSVTHKQKCRGSKKWFESSLNGQLGQTTIALLEEMPPNQQLVVKMTVGKSQTLISCQNKKGKDANSALLTIGPIMIDIPQHPVALHGMMTRSSRQLSTTLQELRSSRQPSRLSRQQMDSETMTSSYGQSMQTPRMFAEDMTDSSTLAPNEQQMKQQLIKPIVFQFTVILDSFTIGASLLPSLRAQYQIGRVTSSGITGTKAKFVIDVHQHRLSFNTKVLPTEANLPSSANVDLPQIHVSSEYMEDISKGTTGASRSESFADGIVLRKGSYLNATADIGSFEHSLTTDLLNHLLLVQKVFMKEVNEVVQKMSGTDAKIIDEELLFGSDKSRRPRYVLFSLHLRLKGIQITATTPTSSAVRLETGQMELQLSNRVQNMSVKDLNLKLFIKLQVDLNVALGQLIRNAMFEEAEPEFQQLAYFKTRISMRNALQDEMVINTDCEDKEAVLITLHRPLVYIQPLALDKAVLVWLNYKNAYEYWNEQRSNLTSEVVLATQQVFGKVQPMAQIGSQTLGTLFLQLTVNDLGACLPITNPNISALNQSKGFESDLKDALVVTLENTQISACSRGSLVSKAQFTSLCIRFADDFETSLDDWKPDSSDPTIRNLCVVSEGTYEICSRTITSHQSPSDAKWLLNVSWKMEGFDIHFDTSIGKHFSALFKTMTAIAGDEDEDEEDISNAEYGNVVIDEIPPGKQVNNGEVESEPGSQLRRGSLLKEMSIDKKRSRVIEKELNEQVKIINDLRQLGASHTTIEQEVQRLHELEAQVFQSFRRDVIKKLRRPSVRQSSFKDKLSIGGKMFSKSMVSYNDSNDFNENSGEDSPLEHFKPGSFDTAVDSVSKLKTSASISIPKSNKQSVPDSPVSQTAASVTNSSFSESQSSCESSALSPSLSVDQSLTSEFKIPKITKRSDSDPRKQGSLSSEYDDSISSSMAERSSGLTAKQSYQTEPNIDFEFDVKIFFNSGKCVLHTKDQTIRDDENTGKRMQKERSFSGGANDSLLSPNHITKSRSSNRLSKTSSNNILKPNISSTRLKHPTHLSGQIADFTVFLIPGLDIKLHYNSKTTIEDSSQPASTRPTSEQRNDLETGGTNSQQSGHLSTKKGSSKKATLFAWITLHSIPDETLISPNILDFLEQALEPIPITLPPKTPTSTTTPNVFNETEAPVPAQYATYASFPVDVIVYFHVQPTVVRFCCLPVSRVECLLHLPSIDLVFSSKRSEDELQSGQCSPPKYAKSGLKSHSTDKHSTDSNPNTSTSSGGLSVTGCLADFSLYIFHPYGGQKKTTNSSSHKDNTESMSYSDRKDSLSLQVEFVKINISRGRKLSISDSIAQSFRFSATCDIGSASFKYDMRRLNEILAFPKAWYRKSIWKRMFIGDHSISAIFSDQEEEDDSVSDSKNLSDTSSEESNETSTTVRTFIRKDSNANREALRLNLQEKTPPKVYRQQHPFRSDSRPVVSSANPWETLVLFSVNLSKLNITMNMGNVMGNTSWLTRGLRSDGRISIDSSGHKSFKIGLALDGSTLDAKGGIVGGIVELSQINTELSVKEVKGNEPKHQLSCSLHTLENRIDYMGTSILMVRVSDLDITLRDEWRIDLTKNYNQSSHPTKRPALIFIHGVLNWDQMQVLMSKSTTPDIMKIVAKLEEFFSQQFHSSKRVFSSLQPKSYNRQSFKGRAKRTQSVSNGSPQLNVGPTQTQQSSDNVSITTEAKHHRHWQKVLRLVSGVQLSTLPNPLPIHGTILGGTLELRACNISLACFYGINFRSKSWGAFSLKQPSISFATEAQNIVNETGSLDTHVVQNLSLMLGRNCAEQYSRKTMATVCKISRNVMFPPQFRHMHEWFHYAFSASEIDDVDRFPAVMELDIFGTPMPSNEYYPSPQVRDRRASASPKTSGDYHHTQEVIFAFPSMQLELKTEHLQSTTTPNPSTAKPTVDCTFVSDFDDHIFVAVDAEAYFFLHELISSYITEKETNVMKSHSPNADRSQKTTESMETMQRERDWREFVCHVWHLEPTLRLLSWAGKNIEPYGVDYILQRLGFSQARTTIPKWIQRTTMDGFDKLLALTMFAMLMKAREDMKDNNH